MTKTEEFLFGLLFGLVALREGCMDKEFLKRPWLFFLVLSEQPNKNILEGFLLQCVSCPNVSSLDAQSGSSMSRF